MKKFSVILVALLFALSISAVAFAADQPAAMPKADTKPAAEKKAKAKSVTGEVTAVDAAAKSVTVKGKKGDMTLMADEKMLKDIKVGEKVTAKYTEQDGKMVAKSIKKGKTKAEKKAKKEEKAAAPAAPAAPAPAK